MSAGIDEVIRVLMVCRTRLTTLIENIKLTILKSSERARGYGILGPDCKLMFTILKDEQAWPVFYVLKLNLLICVKLNLKKFNYFYNILNCEN